VEDEVVPCGLALVQARLLGEDADRGADLGVVAPEAVAADLSVPRRRRDERAQEPQRRRLARAVRSEVPEDLAFSHLEIDGIDRGERSEALRELVRLEDRPHAPSLGAIRVATSPISMIRG